MSIAIIFKFHEERYEISPTCSLASCISWATSKLDKGLLNIKGMKFMLLKSMETGVHSKKSLFQQKFQKKLYHFDRNSQFKSVM